jgi:20S proteasome subunit alpha 3
VFFCHSTYFFSRDKNCGFQLYQSDPSGNYAGWTVTIFLKITVVSIAKIGPTYGSSSAQLNVRIGVAPWQQATAIGANSQAAQSILKTDYVDGMSLLDAKQLAVKVLKKTMDSTLLVPEKVELCEVALENEGTHVRYRVLRDGELQVLCDQANSNVATKE